MKLTYTNNRWEMISSFAEKDEVKKAGFFWDSTVKRWHTSVYNIATTFESVADDEAKNAFDLYRQKVEESHISETITDEIPCPKGYNYYPYQQAGILYAAKRSATLIGDEMGLGKTPQSIGVINLTKPKTVLIICPATLKLNWQKELRRWLVDVYRIHVLNSGETFPTQPEIVIINYDICAKYQDYIRAIEWDLFIADEAHYMKNPKAQRTVAILGKGKREPGVQAKRKILLTGTPITNRPIEIFPLVSYLWPAVFNNFFYFGKLYGGMKQEEKQGNVDRFQSDPSCKVFIGSISAAGVGITLTAASKMIFAELDWTPANMLQAEDRIHRIGQEENALIQQLVFDGSLDAKMAETLVYKMGIIEKALDRIEADEPVDIFEED